MTNRNLLYITAALVAVIIIIAAAASGGGGSSSSKGKNDGLDDAMQAYMNCILTGDKSAFLSFFSQTSNWRFISYRAVTHATVRNTSITYADTVKEMGREGGLWSAFFSGTDQYRYRDKIADHPLRVWVLDGTTYAIPRSEGVISFIRWQKEDDGRWVIKIIGDDSP